MQEEILLFNRFLLIFFAVAMVLPAQRSPLDEAYTALQKKDYPAAIRLFREGLAAEPERVPPRKDLAWTLLKAGETAEAREEFARILKLDPKDWLAALEYAYLCYETSQRNEALAIFRRVAEEGDADSAAKAKPVYQRLSHELDVSIARWKDGVARVPGSFSAWEELARLCEEKSDYVCAAEGFQRAFALRPDMRNLLLDYGRMQKRMNHVDLANAAFLAVSRGSEARIAEKALALFPPRYPWVSEFRQALELDPKNGELRRELAYLLLEMKKDGEAMGVFRDQLRQHPDDLLTTAQLGLLHLDKGEEKQARPLLKKVLDSPDAFLAQRVKRGMELATLALKRREQELAAPPSPTRQLGEQSLEKGYLNDALRYFRAALEENPSDDAARLKLGWTMNMLKRDQEAYEWFGKARGSRNEVIAKEADRAWRNLRPGFANMRLTNWNFPLYSSRWNSLFAYSQVRAEFRAGKMPFRPYVSTRLIGDIRGLQNATGPALSENALLFGAGIVTKYWRGIAAWAETGRAMKYRLRPEDTGRWSNDVRSGVTWARSWGRPMPTSRGGWFFSTNADGVYLSRFENNMLVYSQNRLGTSLKYLPGLQLTWNYNLTTDAKRQEWARFHETGPGVRFQLPGAPVGTLLTVDFLRGYYLLPQPPTRAPQFNDMRIGVWYAFSR
jgi:tetratricopeptide (TPR) repeat protein